jgi:hypothetical protein
MHHGQSETSSHRSINGVAAFAENLYSSFGSIFVDADHNGVLGMDWTQSLGEGRETGKNANN